MARLFLAFLASVFTVDIALAFPSYASLAGLSSRELAEIIPTLAIRSPPSPPGPLNDTSAKLVNDPLHPWKPAGKNDIRGPCPGLNTLASHGWLPRNGIASPSQIITAVQEGHFCYICRAPSGRNLLTDRLSIGGKTAKTGADPPKPAIVGGLDTHGVFEGDASTTRAFSNKFGDGFYNLSVAAEFRFQRIQDSIATNPQIDLSSRIFVDGRHNNPLHLNMTVARGFFQNSRMPDAGANNGTLNSYTLDPNSADFNNGSCKLYTDFVNITVRGLYPNAKGPLLAALNKNLDFFFGPLAGGCTQVPAFT
ncbi:aromatic peroxygenase precursor [Pholiota molesta]|nr:aromatic peroxygenase precursor [Pholiota molesta]